jgi:hypothetical protein
MARSAAGAAQAFAGDKGAALRRRSSVQSWRRGVRLLLGLPHAWSAAHCRDALVTGFLRPTLRGARSARDEGGT